jgi:hypothetical protein
MCGLKMINHAEVVAVLEGLGASGVMAVISAVLSAKLSGGKQKNADPNGARIRLQDEVYWLRAQLDKSKKDE